MSTLTNRADRWTEHKMGRQGPRRPSLMDSAWNQSGSPLMPGEVDNDFQEKPGQKKTGGTPPAGGARNGGANGTAANGASNRAVKFTTEPAAALKLIDTEKRGFAPPGTCMAPLQYRAGPNGANGGGAAENDSMMNPFAKPWTPQVGPPQAPQAAPQPQASFQPIGVAGPFQPMQQMTMPAPQMQQGIQPMMGAYPAPMQPQPVQPMQPNTMNVSGPMNGGHVGCFYATPTIQVAAPYTTMAPMPQVSMVMVQNPGPMSSPQAPQADVQAHHAVGPMQPSPMPQPGRMAHAPGPMAPIGPPQMQMPMQGTMAPQMGMAPQHAMPPAVPHVAPPAPTVHPGEPPLGSPELPSKGSALHAFRACKPCAFFYQEGCSNKEQCAFCHLCEPGERKRRKKERRMARREAQEG